MASIYSYDQDEVWKAAAGAARRGGGRRTDGNRRTLRRLGIPAHYAPAISCSWHGRGENAIKERRTELRAATKTRIAAIEKAAHRIDVTGMRRDQHFGADQAAQLRPHSYRA